MTVRDVNGLSAERLERLREAAAGSTVGDEVFFLDDAGRTRVIGGGEELEAAIRAVRDREARANSPEAQAASRALMESLEPRLLRHGRYLAIGVRVLTGIVVQAMERQLGLAIMPPDPAYRRPAGVLQLAELPFRVVAMLRMTGGDLDRAWHGRMYLELFVPPWERSATLEGRA